MARLTEKIINIVTGEVLAYRLKNTGDRLKALQKLGKYEDAEEESQKTALEKYKQKIHIILKNRLENNCNYNLEINGVKTWLCCEYCCGELDIDTFSRLINEVEKIAEKILKNFKQINN